ncbi:hypothetical protein NRK67_01685 [Fusobacteria bacterium ZRK30]|nr:hypothetical protein NRK67_01685 [Fusobacteria bacterium ZRK30]
MIRVKFTDEILKEIYKKAQLEGRAILGIIYSEYIGIYFPLIETLNPKNIYCSANFISKLLDLDKKIIGDEANTIYMQYAPSIFNFKTFSIEENEIIAGV